MVKKYTANLSNWLKSKLNSTASNSKMNGTQSAGSSDLIARADHVHPVDTSRAPTSHASSGTTYGVGSASNYGHVKVDSSPTDSSSNAVASGGVKTVLDTKQNEVETQAKITSFTNKDRINIGRLINYMENGAGDNYYTLDLKGARGNLSGDASAANFNNSTSVTFSDDKDRLAVTNSTGWLEVGAHFVLGGMIYKNGVAQTSNTSKITFKLIDGTVIGESTYKLNDDSRNQSMRNYKYYYEDWSDSQVVWSLGIYYVYAEATINGSVIRSQILTVFVKDTNNILPYNDWSAGEYSNSIDTSMVGQGKVIISNDFSIIGETCLKYIQRNPANYGYLYIQTPNIIEENTNYIASFDVYCPDASYNFLIRSSSAELSRVTIPVNDNIQHITLSASVGTSSYLRLQFMNNTSDSRLFIDNISLVKS